jgi:hypothetical protein
LFEKTKEMAGVTIVKDPGNLTKNEFVDGAVGIDTVKMQNKNESKQTAQMGVE